MSARGSQGCPSVKHALGEIQQLVIAPLTRVHLSKPDSAARGDAWQRFTHRLRDAEAQAAKDLANQGAFVAYGGEQARISYAGITATATSGLLQAAKNWRAHAQRVLNPHAGAVR